MNSTETKIAEIEIPTLDANVIEVKSVKPKVDVAREVSQVINDKGEVDLSLLSESQIKRCNQLTKSLSLKDINSISNYGADLHNTMTRYSNEFLTAVRASKGGEVGELITDLLNELNYVDIDELREPSLIKKIVRKIPILKHFVNNVEKIFNKYDSIQSNMKRKFKQQD